MSMQEEAALALGDNADMSKVLGDQSFLSSILSSVSLFSLPNAWDSFEITGIYSMFSLTMRNLPSPWLGQLCVVWHE
jgi:hypothetical protein